MKDVNPNWYAESDGGDTWTGNYWSRQPKTHYVVNDFYNVRIDRNSSQAADCLAETLNENPKAGETPAKHIVRLLMTAWPNLHAEGWDDCSAEAIIRTVLGKHHLQAPTMCRD